MTFVPFQPHTVLPAASLNAALTAVDADALAAGTAAAAAATEAGTAETTATAAEAEAAAALAAAQAAGGGTVKTVNGVGPDSSGNVTVATSSGPTLSRPAFSLFTDNLAYGGAPAWSDDGTAFVCSGPTYNSSSSAAPVYRGKPVPAYGSSGLRTLTALVEHDLPDAPGIKCGIALNDAVNANMYSSTVGSDNSGIGNATASGYRPSGAIGQIVSGPQSYGAQNPAGSRATSGQVSLNGCSRLWLRLVDQSGVGVGFYFSRNGIDFVQNGFARYNIYGYLPASATWGVYVDAAGPGNYFPFGGGQGVISVRVESLVES